MPDIDTTRPLASSWASPRPRVQIQPSSRRTRATNTKGVVTWQLGFATAKGPDDERSHASLAQSDEKPAAEFANRMANTDKATGNVPGRATVGRWVGQHARRAGQVLVALDKQTRPAAVDLCPDEIFFGGKPVLVGVEPQGARHGLQGPA